MIEKNIQRIPIFFYIFTNTQTIKKKTFNIDYLFIGVYVFQSLKTTTIIRS